MKSAGLGRCGAAVVGLWALCLIGASPVAAEEMIGSCFDAVGTYLTRNSLPDGKGGTIHSRSLISLANGELQGYLVTEEAVRERWYEAMNSLFASPDAGTMLADKTLELLGTQEA